MYTIIHVSGNKLQNSGSRSWRSCFRRSQFWQPFFVDPCYDGLSVLTWNPSYSMQSQYISFPMLFNSPAYLTTVPWTRSCRGVRHCLYQTFWWRLERNHRPFQVSPSWVWLPRLDLTLHSRLCPERWRVPIFRRSWNNHNGNCRTKLRQYTFGFQGPKFWNKLPLSIVSVKSLPVFKKICKIISYESSKLNLDCDISHLLSPCTCVEL